MNRLAALRGVFRGRRRLRVLSVTPRPAHLKQLLVPRAVVEASLAHLQEAGRRECEEFAFWSGHIAAGPTGIVTATFLPQTTQGRGHVLIEDDGQLLTLVDAMHERAELLLCQLHTHPGEAFHSQADDEGAVTDEVGFVSLVFPRFAVGGLSTAEGFRRTAGAWEPLGRVIETGLVREFGNILIYREEGWRER